MPMLLAARDLTHRFGERRIVDLPSFVIERGDHVLLLGPSGSGKTTLINILTGLTTPTGGEVTLEDRPFSRLRPSERDAARKRTIGLVFQTLRLVSALTIRENLALAQRVAVGRTDFAAIDRLIDRVGLSHRAQAKPRYLSQGEGQRAAIVRALCTKPSLVVADEPTSALDDANARAMIDLMLETADETGATLLIATHDGRIRPRFERTLELAASAP